MEIRNRWPWFKERVIEFLLPSRCIGCGKEGEFLCASCRRALPALLPPLCERCNNPLTWEGRCTSCQRWQLVADGLRSPFRFEGVLREGILQLKYYHCKALAEPLAQLLVDYLIREPLPIDTIVPVPLHPRRLRQRGYNQSSLLAKKVGSALGVSVIEDCLYRLRDTPTQTKATAEDRRANMRAAFACWESQLSGKRVLVIDDVCTTGATLDACAVALKASGVASVWGLTLARET